LIICGHPGDDEHRELFAKTLETIHKALVHKYGFLANEVRVRFGTEPIPGDGTAVSGSRGLSDREGVEAEVSDLRKQIQPDDALWVIVLGHAHHDGRHSWLNLPGPDMRDDEFGKLFQGVQAREQVFFITTQVSGFFIKPLSAAGRVVITATEADQETNETEFPHALAEVLSDPPEDLDADKDGVLTVLDLYLAVVRRAIQRFTADENIPTEHAQLDDNGDGRGTELQLDFLPPDLGGRAKTTDRPAIKPGTDGALAATLRLHDTAQRDIPK
jgi:hypothetical protein